MGHKLMDQKLLIHLGMKEALLNKLSPSAIDLLNIYATENSKLPNLLNTLTIISSLEVQNKKGAIYLMVNRLATPVQLKSLTHQQIHDLVEDHELNHDSKETIRNVRKILVTHQQQKMFTRTDGTRGEFLIDPQEKEV